jgi:hypothetical protein
LFASSDDSDDDDDDDDDTDKGTNAIDEPTQPLPGLSTGVDPLETTDEEDEDDDKADEYDSDDDGDDDASENDSNVDDDILENCSDDNNKDSPDRDEHKNTGVEETHPGEITGVGAPDLQEEINHEMDQ